MSEYRILVSGIGAIIGYGIIRSLRKNDTNVHIVGIDIYEDAVGRMWCDEFIQALPAADNGYIDFLKDIIEQKNIDLVFLGTEAEIYRVYNEKLNQELLSKMVLNSPIAIEAAKDKWDTFKLLKINQLPHIKSIKNGSYEQLSQELGPVFLLKPRQSSASKGIIKIETKADMDYWTQKSKIPYFFQEIIGSDDEEYTIGAFGYGNGELLETQIIFQRTLSKEGATAKAICVKNKAIENYIKQLAKIFKPIGPTNFQVRYHNNQYYLLEINPRISSSTSLRTAFGYNEAAMCLDYYVLQKKLEPAELVGGRAIRFVEDMVFYENSNYF